MGVLWTCYGFVMVVLWVDIGVLRTSNGCVMGVLWVSYGCVIDE